MNTRYLTKPAPRCGHRLRPPGRRHILRKQRGMAVIGALLVVAAAATASTALIERQSVLTRTLASEADRAQAAWLLRGGLNWSRAILRWDAQRNATTRGDGLWAQHIAGLRIKAPDDVREAEFTGRMEDEQGKFNLTQLARDGVVLPEQQQVLERLLALLNVPLDLAEPIAQRVAATQPSADATAQAPALQHLADLAVLAEVTPDVLDALRSYVTVLPERTRINANTASAEVLSASLDVPLAQMRALTHARDQGLWFNNTADFLNRLNEPRIQSAPQIDTSSRWFRVAGEVTLDHAVVGLQALVQRRGSREAPSVRWIRELH